MNKKTDSDVCEFLQWDSDFFGFRIARAKDHHLTDQSIKDILEWVKNNSIGCLYFLAEFDDPKTTQLAHIHDFQLVDIRVTFECDLKKHVKKTPARVNNKVLIRPVDPKDISAMEAIAQVSYGFTRFHFDQHFPKAKSDALYEVWIRRSCEGFADHVLVAEMEKQIAGYVTLKLSGNGQGQIGLIGVREEVRGHGTGKSLINAAFDWFASKDARVIYVVTQGRNVIGQNLYQKCGFTTKAMQLWYHKWVFPLKND